MITLRNSAALALAAAALAACTPSVPYSPSPSSVTTALFDPTHSQIPLPNDLLLLSKPSAALGLPAAEVELLDVFYAQGGFPNDQEVAVTVDFTQSDIDPITGAVTQSAPDLDLSTFTPHTYFMVAQTGPGLTGEGVIQLDPIAATDYVKFSTYGELTLHNLHRAPWVPGEYTLFIRGGSNGVKTTSGAPVQPSSIFYLIEQEQDLTSAANIGLLEAQLGSLQAAEASAAQLNQLEALYKPAFDLADTQFPHTELAVLDTFRIAPLKTQVQLDPNRGLVPLPIDLLRNPVPGGLLTPIAACSLASGTLDAAGVCRLSSGAVDGLAAGFASLDGFSTTGALLAPTSDLLSAATITSSSVLLFDLSNPAAPALVDPTSYITEPSEVQSSGFSPVIALQPAGATAGDPTSVFRTKPLKDATDYAVVITNGVLDKSGQPLGRGTVANILLFDNPLVAGANHTSQLTGVADATAGALEVMREQLLPVISASSALGVSKAQIAMAYTFHTQTILKTAAQLGALPYQAGAEVAAGSTDPVVVAVANALGTTVGGTAGIKSMTAAAAFAEYGLDTTLVPSSNIAEVIDTSIETLNLLDPASGAFLADPSKAALENIKVLISVPKYANGNLAACAGAFNTLGQAGFKCAPMVIFRHGLGGGRADMLTLADSLNAQGMIAVAIDAAKHGDRAFCMKNSECAGAGAVCMPFAAMATEGDAAGATPGTCTTNGQPSAFVTYPVACPQGQAQCSAPTDGIPVASSNFLVSANFFRTRDTLRQDILDQSQLVHALAIAPTASFPTDSALEGHLAASKLLLDPTRIYFVGQLLGSIQGTVDVASNPRISKAALNVGGGTVVDIFTNSPAFKAGVDQLLLSIGVVPGTASYLQFLTVAKTILDPADPLNFAGHLTANTLPNLLASPAAPQAAKKVLTQIAYCDQTVPNPFEYLLASNVPTGPLPGAPGFGVTTGTSEIFVAANTRFNDCPLLGGAPLPPAAVAHAFITTWTPITSQATAVANILTQKAQADAAAFVAKDTLPPSVQTPAQ